MTIQKNVLITGSSGFLGKNLCAHLQRRENVAIQRFDLDTPEADLQKFVTEADVIFHLAGINRPEKVEDFETGNAGFTQTLVDLLEKNGHKPHVIISSSIQAELNNPYGQSKRHGEKILEDWAKRTGEQVSIFRLTNLFGKWCRPNYNSVTATFCHNIANNLPIQISDPNYAMKLAYVDDVVAAFLKEMENPQQKATSNILQDSIPSTTITLGELASRIRFFHDMQSTLMIPDMSERFNQQLYATYMSYVPKEHWAYSPPINTDNRGNLAELVKSQMFGQMFVSRTKPGITRGNHYHHTKIEKFIVIGGEAVIRFRHIFGSEIIEFPVKGEDYRIVEIPPGYTHNITNTGTTELITLFWSSEIFDKEKPDTYFEEV
ncbi:MAG: NAD-dependent epimerase/dehydratase family protein [Planctomycetaceae bacterium]|jgi:UDP-2-acetamido-2,6-beta-L-arabino-hexul-4-ose reductase|nr:NAD-dependent epimerase/dehydratase family protein [Planctomycetaceae bacterium]